MDASGGTPQLLMSPYAVLGLLNGVHPDQASERQVRHIKRVMNQAGHAETSVIKPKNVNRERLSAAARLLERLQEAPSSSSKPACVHKSISTQSNGKKGDLGGLGPGVFRPHDEDADEEDEDDDYVVDKEKGESTSGDSEEEDAPGPSLRQGRRRSKKAIEQPVKTSASARKDPPKERERVPEGEEGTMEDSGRRKKRKRKKGADRGEVVGRPRSTGSGSRNSYRNEPHKRKHKPLPPPIAMPLLLTHHGSEAKGAGALALALVDEQAPAAAAMVVKRRRKFLALPCQKCTGCKERSGCLRMALGEMWRSADESLHRFADPLRAAQPPRGVQRERDRSVDGASEGSDTREDDQERADLGYDQVFPTDPASLSLILQPWLHPKLPIGLSTHIQEAKLASAHDKYIRLLSAGRSTLLTPGQQPSRMTLLHHQDQGEEAGPSGLTDSGFQERQNKSFDKERTVPKDIGCPVIAKLSAMRARRHPSEILKLITLPQGSQYKALTDLNEEGAEERRAEEDLEHLHSLETAGRKGEGVPSEARERSSKDRGKAMETRKGLKHKFSRADLAGIKQRYGYTGSSQKTTTRRCQWCNGEGHVTRECPLWLLCTTHRVNTEDNMEEEGSALMPPWFQKVDPCTQEIMARVQEVASEATRSRGTSPMNPESLLAYSILAQEIATSEMTIDAQL